MCDVVAQLRVFGVDGVDREVVEGGGEAGEGYGLGFGGHVREAVEDGWL